MQLLEWKKLSNKMQQDLAQKAKNLFPSGDKYVWIIYLWDNKSSKVYVWLKQKYGEKIRIPTHIFGQYKKWDNLPDNTNNDYDVQLYMKQEYDSVGKVIDLIDYLNTDKDCIWIIVQLPLPEKFQKYKAKILSTIAPDKDIDGMGGILTGLSSIDVIDFVPATPKAVVKILDEYKLWDLNGKIVSIIWQSNLVWKPLTMECIKRWATVYTCNKETPVDNIKNMTKQSDIIISCTWVVHLINQDFVRDDNTQTIIDVWYGHKDGKPVGDVDFDSIKDKVKYITPVPGGIWPLTVACLFDNIFTIQESLGEIN